MKPKVVLDVSKCDLPSEDIRTATSWICYCDIFGEQTVFEGWINMKQMEVSEFLSENLKMTSRVDVQDSEHRNISNKNYDRVKVMIL